MNECLAVRNESDSTGRTGSAVIRAVVWHIRIHSTQTAKSLAIGEARVGRSDLLLQEWA